MYLQKQSSGPFATNAYVIIHEKQALIFDPAPESAEWILDTVKDLHVQGIYLTHSHWDHIGDVALLKEKLNAPVYVHTLDSKNLEDPGSDGLPLMFPIQGAKADGFLTDRQRINFNGHVMEVIHTPGHTPGGVCFYIKEENILISGDTLFKGSIGNLSFPTADPDAMWQSLEKLAKLRPNTKVYPGHGPETTIGVEDWLTRAQEIFS